MKKNVGNVDKIVRWVISLLLLGLYFTDVVTGTLGIIFIVVAVILIVTTFISFCPLYLPFGIRTNKDKE